VFIKCKKLLLETYKVFVQKGFCGRTSALQHRI